MGGYIKATYSSPLVYYLSNRFWDWVGGRRGESRALEVFESHSAAEMLDRFD